MLDEVSSKRDVMDYNTNQSYILIDKISIKETTTTAAPVTNISNLNGCCFYEIFTCKIIDVSKGAKIRNRQIKYHT